MTTDSQVVYRMVSTYLFDTCTHKCGYCWLAESGMVLDAAQLAPFRDDAFIRRVTSFFNRRTTETEKWTLQLTGGEPLLMPNLPAFCEQLFAYGNRVAFYTALDILSRRHPSYRFLLEHGAPSIDYIMASFHPESEVAEDEYFDRLAALKEAGHRVFLRYVGHPERLVKLGHLAKRCQDLDVCFYPTTLFSPTYPSAYSEEQRTILARHFSSNAQRIQLEGGIAVKGILCNSGSLNLALRFPSGDFTPCISTFHPVLGNLFEDRLTLLPGPAPCPDQKIVCICDIHFQQDIVPNASDSKQFQRQLCGWTEPIPVVEQDEWLKTRGIRLGGAIINVGQIRDDSRLVYSRSEVVAAFDARRADLPQASLLLKDQTAVASEIAWLPLDSFEPVEGSDISTTEGGVVLIRTQPQPWAYAAVLPLSDAIDAKYAALSGKIELTVIVHRGPVGAGVLTQDGKHFLWREQLSETHNAMRVSLRIPKLSDAGPLVIQTWDQPVAGLVEISDGRLYVWEPQLAVET